MFKGYAKAIVLVALLSAVIAAAGFAVTTGQFDSSNSVADETGDNDVDVFPLAGVTEENLAAIYGAYDIFTVDSATDLNKLSAIVNGTFSGSSYSFAGKTVRLTADLNLGGQLTFVPIGLSPTAGFSGTFDGGGHVISDLTVYNVNDSTGKLDWYAGLFGCVVNGQVLSVTISDSTVAGTQYIGAVAGKCDNSTIADCINENTTVISSDASNYQVYLGGLVGQMYNSSLAGSMHSTGEIEIESVRANAYLYVGGLFGALSASSASNGAYTLTGAYFSGYIDINLTVSVKNMEVGGIIGSDYDSSSTLKSVLDRCSNCGTIKIRVNEISTGAAVGGIVGDCHGKIVNSTNAGNIRLVATSLSNNTQATQVGGLAGRTTDSITGSQNTGDIAVIATQKQSPLYIGGLVGYSPANINHCYNTGNLTATIRSSTGFANGLNMGGIAGQVSESSSTAKMIVADCFNEGSISNSLPSGTHTSYANVNVGGIIGYSKAVVRSCVSVAPFLSYDEQTVGGKSYSTNTGGIVGKANGVTHAGIQETDCCGYLNVTVGTAGKTLQYACGFVQADVNEPRDCPAEFQGETNLKSSAFLAKLNAYDNAWVADTDHTLNNGYPLVGNMMVADLIYDQENGQMNVAVEADGLEYHYLWQRYDHFSGRWTDLDNVGSSYTVLQKGEYRVIVTFENAAGQSFELTTEKVETLDYVSLYGVVASDSSSTISGAEVTFTAVNNGVPYTYTTKTAEDGYYLMTVPYLTLNSLDNKMTVSAMGYVTYTTTENLRNTGQNEYYARFDYRLTAAADPMLDSGIYYFDSNPDLATAVVIGFYRGTAADATGIALDGTALTYSRGTDALEISADALIALDLSAGDHRLTVSFGSGGSVKTATAVLKVTCSEAPSCTLTEYIFNKSSPADLHGTVGLGTGALAATSFRLVSGNGTVLNAGTDYTYAAPALTLSQNYLTTLPCGISTLAVVFNLNGYVTTLELTITVEAGMTVGSDDVLDMTATNTDTITVNINAGAQLDKDKFKISASASAVSAAGMTVGGVSVSGTVGTVTVSKNGNLPSSTLYLWYDGHYIGQIYCIVTNTIPTVEITVTVPATGAVPDKTATAAGHYKVSAVGWTPNDAVFALDTAYTATVTVTANSRHVFATDVTATINGFTVTDKVLNTDGTLTLHYTFRAGYWVISFAKAGSETGNVPSSIAVNDGGTAVVPGSGTLVYEGYTFVGWQSGDKLYYANDRLTVTGNLALTAVWGYPVTSVLSNCSLAASAGAVAANGTYSNTLIAATGYSLPAGITVTMGESTLTAGTGYTYNSTDGTISVPNVIGALKIEAAAVPQEVMITLTHTEAADGGSGVVTFAYTTYRADGTQYSTGSKTDSNTGSTITGVAIAVPYGGSLTVTATPPAGHVITEWENGLTSAQRSASNLKAAATWSVNISNVCAVTLSLHYNGAAYTGCADVFILVAGDGTIVRQAETGASGTRTFSAAVGQDYSLHVRDNGVYTDTGIDYRTENATFSATVDYYTVVYHFLNGTADETVYVISGMPSYLGSPARTGYLFDGWYTDEACTAKWNVSTPIRANTALYAGWSAAVTITLDPTGGIVSPAQITRRIGSTYGDGAMPLPTYEGRQFKAWYVERNGSYEAVVSETEVLATDTALKAVWEETAEYSISYELGPLASWTAGYTAPASYFNSLGTSLPGGTAIAGQTLDYWYAYEGTGQTITPMSKVPAGTSKNLVMIAVYKGATVTVAAAGSVYDGAAKTAFDYTVTVDDHQVTKSAYMTFSTVWTANGGNSSLSSDGHPVTAGTYTAAVTLTSGNYYGTKVTEVSYVIGKLPLKVTCSNLNKVYDGTAGYSGFTVDNLVGDDNVTVTAAYAQANAGTNLNISFAMTGTDAANYSLPAARAGNIAAYLLTYAENVSKTYNGGKDLTVTIDGITPAGAAAAEEVELLYTASAKNAGNYSQNAAGNGYTVEVTNVSAGITGNYTLGTGFGTYTINVKEVSAVLASNTLTRQYDGTTSVAINVEASVSGALSSDKVSFAADSLKCTISAADVGTYSSANTGSNTVTDIALVLTGEDAANYELSGQPALEVVITKAVVTVSAAASYSIGKTYDGNVTCTLPAGCYGTAVSSMSALPDGVLTVNSSVYDAKDAGARTVTVTFGLSETAQKNYQFNNGTAAFSLRLNATITALQLVAVTTLTTPNSWRKTYDGTAVYTAFKLDNVKTGDTVTVTAKFDSAGTDAKQIAFSNLAGKDAANYSLPAAVVNGGTCSVGIDAATFSAPTDLTWNAGVASWSPAADIGGTAARYTVSLYKNNVEVGSSTVTGDSTSHDYTALIAATGAGTYAFKVFADSSSANVNDSTAAVSGDTAAYTVTFNYNGEDSDVTQTVVSGGLAIRPADPASSGHKFLGWYREAAGTTVWTFGTDTVTGDVSIYAKWSLNAPTISDWKSTYDLTYSGSGQTLTVTAAAPSADSVLSYQWYKNGMAIDGATAASLTVTDVSDSGRYYVTVTATCSKTAPAVSLTSSVSSADTVVTIARAANSWTAGPACSGFIYSGQAAAATATAKFGTPSFAYYTDTAMKVPTGTADGAAASGGAPKNAGTYWVKVTVIGTADYATLTGSLPFLIEQKALTLVWSDASTPLVYSGLPQQPTATVSGAADGETVTAGLDLEGTDRGTYGANVELSVTGGQALASNYSFEATHTYTIGQKALSIADQTRTYDGSKVFEFEVDGVNGEKIAIKYTAASAAVGTYSGSELTASYTADNYSVTCGSLTILKAVGAIEPPAIAEVTDVSVTVAAGIVHNGDGTVTYACSTGTTAPTTGWQSGLTFSDLTINTTYWIFARQAETSNCSEATSYTMVKTNQAVIAAPEITGNLTYNQTLTAALASGVTAKISWYYGPTAESTGTLISSDTFPGTGTNNTATLTLNNAAWVGKYIRVVTEGTGSYQGQTSWTSGQTVAKAAVAISLENGTAKDYNGDQQPISTAAAVSPASGGAVTYTYYTDSGCTVKTAAANGALTAGGAPAAAGTYYVKAAVAATNVYLGAETAAAAVHTIDKVTLSAPADLKWTLSLASWSAVTAVDSSKVGYTVQLLKDGQAYGQPLSVTGLSYDFGSAINAVGSYSFTVTAVPANSSLSSSAATASSAINAYQVSFQNTHDNTAPAAQIVVSGGLVSPPARPTAAGHTFGGWYNGETKWNFGTSTVTSSVTLKTVWSLNAPTISAQPEALNFTYDGTDHALTVAAAVADSEITITYQWYKNGTAIDGATAATLTVTHVSDSGTYSVRVAANHMGETASVDSAAVSVSIQKYQLHATLNEGNTWNKTYDGNNAVVTGAFRIDAYDDRVTCTATYADANAAANKKISFSLDENSAADYLAPVSVSGTIGKYTLTVTLANGGTKTYDGNTTCIVSSINKIGTDDVTVTALYPDANAAENIPLELTLAGTAAGNYALPAMTGTISPYQLDSISAHTVTYDGTYTFYRTDFPGIVGETVTLEYDITVNAIGAIVGTYQYRNGSGFSVTPSGAGAGNYAVSNTASVGDLTIAEAELTLVGATATARPYDGTTAVGITGYSLYGVITSGDKTDDVTVASVTGTADAAAAGSRTVTLAVTLAGTDMGNYKLTQPENLTVTIGRSVVLIDAVSGDPIVKTYDGTKTVPAGYTISDYYSVKHSGSLPDLTVTAEYNTQRVNASQVRLDFALGAGDETNYDLRTASLTVAGHIDRLQLTAASTADSGSWTKAYDGTAAYTLFELTNVVAGDDVKVSARYNAVTVADAAAIEFYGLTGANSGNYTLPAGVPGTIAKAVFVLDRGLTATYNGTTAFECELNGYTLTVTAASAAAGADLPIVAAVIDSPDYYKVDPGTFTLTVEAAVLDLTAYSATYTASPTFTRTCTGLDGETVNVTYTAYAADVGTYRYVATAELPEGAYQATLDNPNYRIYQPGDLTVNAASLTLTVSGTKTYDGAAWSHQVSTAEVVGLRDGSAVTGTVRTAGSAVGTYDTLGEFDLSAVAVSSNYVIAAVSGQVTIIPALLTGITATAPVRTAYAAGETFDPAGMIVTASYSDGSTAPVTGYTWTPRGALSVTDTTVTVTYTEGDLTFSAAVAITVAAEQTYTLELLAAPAAGGTVTGAGTYASGREATVAAVPAAGYRFVSWSDGGAAEHQVTVSKDLTLTAVFEKESFAVTASAGEHGTIAPAGTTAVAYGGSVTYTAQPDPGYMVAAMLVDGISVGAVGSYTFENVTAAHTVEVTFTAGLYRIAASAGAHGTIAPAGTTEVAYGSSVTYTMTAAADYRITGVLVDGISVGAVGSYTFENVTAAHTISVSFGKEDGPQITVTVNGDEAPNAQVTVNGVAVTAGSVSAASGSNTLRVVPDTGYYIEKVLVNGTAVAVTGAETGMTLDLGSGTAAAVDISVRPIYSPGTVTDATATVTGTVRYDAQLTVTATALDQNAWGIVWDSSATARSYEVVFTTAGGAAPFLGTLEVTLPAGTGHDGQTATVYHLDATTGSLESFKAAVTGETVTVTVASLSPFLVVLPAPEESSGLLLYVIAAVLIAAVLLLLLMLVRRRRNDEEEP